MKGGKHMTPATNKNEMFPHYYFLNMKQNKIKDLRGVFKKFAAQPRRKTNFRTQRGVRDVTLLKRPLTQPLANRSSCFAQAVGCCKNVCYFCRTQRTLGREQWFHSKCYRKVSQGLSTNTCWQHRGNVISPYRSVKARIELFKAGRQNIEDDLLSVRPPGAVPEENVEEVGHLVMNELQCRSETSQRKCRYMMHPPKQLSFGISICSVCPWRQMPKCQIQNKGKFVRRRLVMFWTSPEYLLTRFSTQDETRVSSLGPWEQERFTPVEPPCATIAKEEKVVNSAGKVMVTVFWDIERLLRVDFLDYGINMNW